MKGTKAIGTQPSKPWPILASAQEREPIFGTKQDIKELQTRLEQRAVQKEAVKSAITLWISTDPSFRAWCKEIIEHNTLFEGRFTSLVTFANTQTMPSVTAKRFRGNSGETGASKAAGEPAAGGPAARKDAARGGEDEAIPTLGKRSATESPW